MRYSFNSKINFELWLFLNNWLTIPYKSPCTCRDIITKNCCCCCECQLLFSVTFGAGRGVESLSNSIRSLFFRDYSVDAICWHKTVYDDCMWLRLPEVQSLILCSGLFRLHKRHLDYVSNDCDSALFEKLCNHHGVLLHRNLHQMGQVV